MSIDCQHWSPEGCAIAGALCKLLVIPVKDNSCDCCISNIKPKAVNSITVCLALDWARANNIAFDNDRKQLLLQVIAPTIVPYSAGRTVRNFTKVYEKYKLGTDKGAYVEGAGDHTYLDFYENELSKYVGHGPKLLELGIWQGYSLLLWRDCLVNAEVHGADINIPNMLIGDASVCCHSVDCGSAESLSGEFADMVFDIIIDDASHQLQHQLISFDILFPKVITGGVYIIEDVVPDIVESFIGRAQRMELFDFRNVKGRFDDMLLVFRK